MSQYLRRVSVADCHDVALVGLYCLTNLSRCVIVCLYESALLVADCHDVALVGLYCLTNSSRCVIVCLYESALLAAGDDVDIFVICHMDICQML